MFSKSRRPVPSRAALRVLYQLAYISSGTAVGVATLCAEERRRRTHYVQKIADNAKRLRQSPRHVHNVAAAKKVNEHVMGQDSGRGGGGEFWEEQSRDDHSRVEKGRVRMAESESRLVRASELPSVVERGYAQVTKDHKRVRRRLPFEDRASQYGAEKEKAKSRVSGSVTDRQPYRPLLGQRGESRHDFQGKLGHEPPSTERFKMRRNSDPPVIQRRPSFRLEEAAELVELSTPGTVRAKVRSPSVVRHDVKTFLQSTPWTSSELQTEARVANCLLSEGLRQGCLAEIGQLVRWKLANDKMSEEDVADITEANLTVDLDGHDPLKWFEMFAELFESKAFQKLPEHVKLSAAVSVTADSLCWDIEMNEELRARRLLNRTLRSSQDDSVEQAVRILCDKCLATGQLRRAWNVVNSARKGCSWRGATTSALNRRWKGVYDSIVEYAKTHGELWVCVKYAALLVRTRVDPDGVPFIEWVLRELRRRGTLLPARNLASHLFKSERWQVLSDHGKVDLALALSAARRHDLDEELEKLFSAIPQALRGPVAEAWCADRLQTVWKTQRDLSAVWREYERAKRLQFERFGTAELTLIEICNQARQPDQALRLLASSVQQEVHNAASLCVAAVSMARKSAWKQLRGLLQIIGNSGKFVNDGSTSRNLNTTINIYSRYHTAAETWKFVTDMIANIGFVPNRTTTDIMLQCFVSKQTLDMIPQWMRYLRTIGNDFQMSSTTATKLLSCFYFDQRPPHVLLVWFGRNLSNKWQSFDAGEMRELIKLSIGYDLRKLPAQDKASLRERAQHNLATLTVSDRGIPAPYRATSKREFEDAESGSQSPTVIGEAAGHRSSSFEPLGQPRTCAASEKRIEEPQIPSTDNVLHPNSVAVESTQNLTHSTSKASEEVVISQEDEFEDLRPQYQTNDPTPGEDEHSADMLDDSTSDYDYIHEDKRRRRIIRDMVLALSLRQYNTVLDLYRASTSPTGLPISPLSLEVATEATIRLAKGDLQEATAMMDAAKEAGMEVRRAMGPLIVHQIHSLDSFGKKDANALRVMVIDYYRSNEENGFPVKHHVGITAANTLINNLQPEHGINILNAIYHSDWAIDRPLDIVAMTVYLKGYAMLKSQSGIQWVVRMVLTGDMPIDRPFIAALKDVCKSFGVALVRRTRTRRHFDRTGFIEQLRLGRQRCIERRHQQRFQTKKFGNLLVKRILQCVEMGKRPAVEMENRKELEEAFFGGPAEGVGGHDTGVVANRDAQSSTAGNVDVASQGKTPNSKPTMRSSRLEARRAESRLATAIRFQGKELTGTMRTSKQTRNLEWLKRYRAFTRKDLIMADGKLASFRRVVN